MELVDRIFNLFKQSGKKYIQLAGEIGIKSSTITQWKKGKQKPSLDAVVKIADYFDVPVDFLLGRGTFSSDLILVSEKGKKLLRHFDKFDEHKKDIAIAFTEGLARGSELE
jgi:transcriptional regulator with XRE-family HTH domain